MSQSVGDLIVSLNLDGARFHEQVSRARTQLGGFSQATELSTRHIDGMKQSLLGVTSVLGGVFAVKSMISAADAWGQYEVRLRMVTNSTEELAMVQQRLMEISDRTYKPIEEQQELFIRSANAMKEYGYSTSETVDFIDSVSSSLTINAATTEKGASAIEALSRSMVIGTVSGKNWNTIMAVMPTAVGDIARYMGITEMAVKKLAREGKLSMEQFSNAMIDARERNAELAEKMPTTVGDAVTRMSNHWKAYLGDVNNTTGATQVLSGGINALTDNMDRLVLAGELLAAGAVSRYFAGMATNMGKAAREALNAKKNQIALAGAHLQSAQALQNKATMERRAAQAALYAAEGTNKQRLATLALVEARRREEAATNAVTAAQLRLNSATSIWRNLGRGMLGVLGGPVGLAMTVASVAGGFLLMRNNGDQAANTLEMMKQPIDALIEKYRSLDDVQQKTMRENLASALESANTNLKNAENSLKTFGDAFLSTMKAGENYGEYVFAISPEKQQAWDDFQATIERIGDSGLGVNETTKALLSATEELVKNTGMNKQEADALHAAADAWAKAKVEVVNYTTGLKALFDATQDAINANRGLARSLDFSKQLTSAKLNLDVSELKAKGLTKQAHLLGKAYAAAGDKASEFSAEIQQIVASGGKISVAPRLEGVRDLVAVESQIYDNDEAAKTFAQSIKAGGKEQKHLADSFDRQIRQQQQQITLYGQTTEYAKIHYELTRGELSALSDQQKAALEQNALELDRLNIQQRYKSLLEELRTPSEALVDSTRKQIELLNEAAPAAEEYETVMNRIIKASIEGAPKYKGLDASIGGPISGVIDTANAMNELDKWYSDQLALQQEFLEQKRINETAYNENMARLNEAYGKRQTDIQDSTRVAAMSGFAEMAGGAAQMAQQIFGESSGAYRALFVMQKAFAVAAIIMNAHIAAAKAPAELTILGGISVGTALLASGYASAAMVAGMALAGMAHDGIDSVPATGTWLLQKGERVVTAQTSAKLDETLDNVQQQRSEQLATGMNYSPTINVNGDPDDRTMMMLQDAVKQGAEQGYNKVVNSLARGQGKAHDAVNGLYAKRKTR